MIKPEDVESMADMWDSLAELAMRSAEGREDRERHQLEGMAAAFNNCAAYARLKIAIAKYNS
jgi:hypothetical protein